MFDPCLLFSFQFSTINYSNKKLSRCTFVSESLLRWHFLILYIFHRIFHQNLCPSWKRKLNDHLKLLLFSCVLTLFTGLQWTTFLCGVAWLPTLLWHSPCTAMACSSSSPPFFPSLVSRSSYILKHRGCQWSSSGLSDLITSRQLALICPMPHVSRMTTCDWISSQKYGHMWPRPPPHGVWVIRSLCVLNWILCMIALGLDNNTKSEQIQIHGEDCVKKGIWSKTYAK